MTCDVWLQLAAGGAMCGSKLRRACRTHFGSTYLAMCVRAVHFKACDVRPHIAHYFSNNERTDDHHLLSFGVSYYFVAQKWRILAIFHKKIFFGNYLEGIVI